MEMQGPFIINDEEFSKEEFLSLSTKKLALLSEGSWEHDLYSFIIDFLDNTGPILQRTSGTTGDPKELTLNREAMITSANMTIKHFDLAIGSRVLLCLPLQYIAGKMMVVRALVGRLNLITTEPTSRPMTNVVGNIDFAAMVPMQVYESIRNNDPVEEIGKLLIGGGVIDQSLLQRIQKLDKVEIFESFAMSETYTHFASRRINGEHRTDLFESMNGVFLGQDERGCLVVDLPGVTDGRVITNDMVSMMNERKFLWLGRIDHVIKSGGVKIIPEILEAKIREIIHGELLIIGIPDEKLGQKLILVIEGDKKSHLEEIYLSKLKTMLEKHEIPKRIVVIESIPRNYSMKPDRIATQKLLMK